MTFTGTEKNNINLFFKDLSLPVNGEATQDLFSAESQGFKSAVFYVVIMIGSLTFIGIIYEIIRILYKRAKVAPEGNSFFP